jgi:hypothetical protein
MEWKGLYMQLFVTFFDYFVMVLCILIKQEVQWFVDVFTYWGRTFIFKSENDMNKI